MRRRTLRQTAMYDLLVLRDEALRPLEVVRAEQTRRGGLPRALLAQLPESQGSARDVLEALRRRGEVTRRSGTPARYLVEWDRSSPVMPMPSQSGLFPADTLEHVQ